MSVQPKESDTSKMSDKDFILVFNYADAIESIKTYYNKIQE